MARYIFQSEGYCSTTSDIMISVAFSWGYPSQTVRLRMGQGQESVHLEEGGLCRFQQGQVFLQTQFAKTAGIL